MKKIGVTGHRPKLLPWGYDENDKRCVKFKANLEAILEKAIQNDYTYFVYGGAIGIDQIFAEIVLKLKKRYPCVKLECIVPCEGQDVKWHDKDKIRYRQTLAQCDTVTILQQSYTSDCMNNRNKRIVEEVDVLLAVWNGELSGTYNTIRFAKDMGKKIRLINLNEYFM